MNRFLLLAVATSLLACGADPVLHGITLSPSTVDAGSDVELTMDIENFELRAPADVHSALTAAEGEHGEHGDGEEGDYPDGGHFHVYLDDVMTNPLPINCPDHCKHPAFAKTVRVRIPSSATNGTHTIIARLNSDSHMILTPHIRATAMLTVTSTN